MTSASINSSEDIAAFLSRALAGGALAVGELEAEARAAGLLGERQQIQHAKAFKKAKKSLGIPMKTRSVLCDLKPADGASCVFEVSSRELKDTVVEGAHRAVAER